MDESTTVGSLTSTHTESPPQCGESSTHRRIIRADITFNVIELAEVSVSTTAISPDSHEDVIYPQSGTLAQVLRSEGSPITVYPSNDIIYLAMDSKDYSLFSSLYPDLAQRAKFVAIDFGDPTAQFERLFRPVEGMQLDQTFQPFRGLQVLYYVSTGGTEEGRPGTIEFKKANGLEKDESSLEEEIKEQHGITIQVSIMSRVQIGKERDSQQ